jgi:hypothetical protein
MKKILFVLFLFTAGITSCTKPSPQAQVVTVTPSATITSVAKVNAGSNWTIRINYNLSGLDDVESIYLTGSTWATVPLVAGAGTRYDNSSALGQVKYNFLIIMKNGTQTVTPLQIFNV